MTHFIRTVASSAVLAANHSSLHQQEKAFALYREKWFFICGIGIDNFKLAREQHVSRHAPSIGGFKKRFLDSVNNTSVQVFTEDLRNMIMAADTDEEINAVIQALRKYNTSKLKFTEFHFGSPVMRLLYIHNKSDLAMQLYMDDNLKDIFQDSGSALVLLNKLIEDKRYDDAIKIFEYGSRRGYSTISGRAYPTDVVTLTIEALYRQNTKQSLEKAKEVISTVMQRDADINPRTATMIALLAVQHGEASFAMEILGAVRAKNLTTIQNIRAICYAELGRVEEAINVVHLLADQPPIEDDRRRVFPIVLQHIQKAVEQSKEPDLKARFEDLSKFISTNNRLSTTDLVDFINEPISRRGAIMHNRQGVQQAPSGGYQRAGGHSRDTGFQGGFNQRSGYQRQGPGGGGNYSQDNRRFQGGNYERRAQNPPAEGDRFPSRNQRSALNDYSRQESFQQQPVARVDRNNSAGLRERESSKHVSQRGEPKPGVMETTSTSPIPQRSKQTDEDNLQLPRRKSDNQSSSFGKNDERLTGGNTGIQQQSPWEDGGNRSS